MLLQLVGPQLDPHRQALHHLQPVAGGILRRQQREDTTGTSRQPFHLTVVGDLVPIEIGLELNRLPNPELFQLNLLEVGIDLQLIQRHHRHQRGTNGDMAANLDRTFGDDAADRAENGHALQIEPGLAHQFGGVTNLRLLSQWCVL